MFTWYCAHQYFFLRSDVFTHPLIPFFFLKASLTMEKSNRANNTVETEYWSLITSDPGKVFIPPLSCVFLNF